MKLIIDSSGGFELEDKDTGDKFEFAGNLAALTAALTSSGLGQGQVERLEIAGGEILLDELFITGELNG